MFPGLGRLFTNRANRIEFSFDPLIREYFELARHAIVPEVRRQCAASTRPQTDPYSGNMLTVAVHSYVAVQMPRIHVRHLGLGKQGNAIHSKG